MCAATCYAQIRNRCFFCQRWPVCIFNLIYAKIEDIRPGSTTILFGYSAILRIVIGTGMGAYNAAKLAFPDFVTGVEMFSFGHMRQVHVMAVIFGWISMAFAMTMMYMTT